MQQDAQHVKRRRVLRQVAQHLLIEGAGRLETARLVVGNGFAITLLKRIGNPRLITHVHRS